MKELNQVKEIVKNAELMNLKETLQKAEENLPMLIEHYNYMAKLWMAKYNALISVGFTEEQSIRMCMVPEHYQRREE